MRPLTADVVETQLRAALDAGDRREIDRLGALLDGLERHERVALGAAALWYASVGLHVFPLQPGQKIPMPRTHGCKDATDDAEVVRAWWTATPDANIGIATGHLVDVIDVDGPAGVQSWARLSALPPVLGKVSTPRDGGNHLYVAATGRGNRAGIAPGIDYRGAGGYVVAPPSVNAEGVAYRWYAPLDLTVLEEAA